MTITAQLKKAPVEITVFAPEYPAISNKQALCTSQNLLALQHTFLTPILFHMPGEN